MSIYYVGSNKESSSVTGKLTAKFNNNFKFSDYYGIPNFFITNRKKVVLSTKHKISSTEWNSINIDFPANIENRRYEFQPNGIVTPPLFIESWEDPDGGSWHRPYNSKDYSGHITFDFNFEAGTLEATFNFTILVNTEAHQVVGKIDVVGLEHVESGQRHMEKLFK